MSQFVDGIRDNPAARLASRVAFYQKYGEAKLGEYGYGNAELAFMKWENGRVLRAPDAQPPGSAWWNELNLKTFIPPTIQ